MKYVQPYGEVDPEAPYINGDPSIGRMGSIPPAAAFEHPMRELVATIDYSLFIPEEDDLKQLAKAIRSQRMNYAEDTGSINTLSVAFDPPLGAYTVGLPIRVKMRETNTGPCTIDAGAGRVSVKKPTGADMNPADLRANGLAELVYDGTNFQVINFGGAGEGSGGGGGGDTIINTYTVNIPYTTDSGTVNNVVADFSPSVEELVPGTIIMVKMSNTNTGATTITVENFPAKQIYALGAGAVPTIPFMPGDIQAGDVVILTYDGIRFWMTPNPLISQMTTFPIANTTELNNLFVGLSRKRIATNAAVVAKLGIGVFQGFALYHVDAKRITVEGTMHPGMAVPQINNFARTGSSSTARAADSANNIAMLRSRYGTRIVFDNGPMPHYFGTVQPSGWIGDVSYGPIMFKNFLIEGANAPHPVHWMSTFALQMYRCFMVGVTCWGCGGYGIFIGWGEQVFMWNCHFVGNWGIGLNVNSGGTLNFEGGTIIGNNLDGIWVTNGAKASLYGVAIQCNGGAGVYTHGGGIANIYGGTGGTSYVGQVPIGPSIVTLNATYDLYTTTGSTTVSTLSGGSGTSVGTFSPAPNVLGNTQSINITL